MILGFTLAVIALIFAQFFAFAFARRQSFVNIDAELLLPGGRRIFWRKTERDTFFAPLQLDVFPEMTGRFVAVSAIFGGFDPAFFGDEFGKSVRPFIKIPKNI